jgi:hypothetical protein
VNPETRQQLYGGEVSDYFSRLNPKATDFQVKLNSSQLESVYSSQVQPKGSVNVKASGIAFNPAALIDSSGPDPLSIQLSQALSKIAQDYGINADTQTNANFTPTIKDQSYEDLQRADDAVRKALEELKTLGEL